MMMPLHGHGAKRDMWGDATPTEPVSIDKFATSVGKMVKLP